MLSSLTISMYARSMIFERDFIRCKNISYEQILLLFVKEFNTAKNFEFVNIHFERFCSDYWKVRRCEKIGPAGRAKPLEISTEDLPSQIRSKLISFRRRLYSFCPFSLICKWSDRTLRTYKRQELMTPCIDDASTRWFRLFPRKLLPRTLTLKQ